MAPSEPPLPPPPFAGREQSQPCVHPRGAEGGPMGAAGQTAGQGGFGEGGRGQPRLSPPPSSRASGDTAQPFSLPEHPPGKRVGAGAVCGAGGWVSPCPGALPSCHPRDLHGAVTPHRDTPHTHMCRCLGLGGAGAAGSIAPLRVPIRALCGSPLNCHHELPSMLASTWGARPSGSPWQGQHEDVAGSDTEPIVPGHPMPQPTPSHRAGTWGCTGTAAPGTTSPPWPMSPAATRLQALGSVPTLRSPTPGTTPAEGLRCAMLLAGTGGGAAELWSCAAPLPP